MYICLVKLLTALIVSVSVCRELDGLEAELSCGNEGLEDQRRQGPLEHHGRNPRQSQDRSPVTLGSQLPTPAPCCGTASLLRGIMETLQISNSELTGGERKGGGRKRTGIRAYRSRGHDLIGVA